MCVCVCGGGGGVRMQEGQKEMSSSSSIQISAKYSIFLSKNIDSSTAIYFFVRQANMDTSTSSL